MTQPDPELVPVDPGPLAAAVGLPGAEAAFAARAAGLTHVLVATDADITSLRPDPNAVSRAASAVGGMSIAPVRRLDDYTLHVRLFAPGAGVGEDPGTGSAAGPIGMMARQEWGAAREVTILQGAEIGRPCRIEVVAEPGDVRVGGAVTACAEGRFTL
jgi:trans-2,3-dihydro-3-hydroxyanthranilate isomerase